MPSLDITTMRRSVEPLREIVGDTPPLLTAVLGSGWGKAIGDWTIQRTISYNEIPVLGSTAVKGHAGALHIADTGHGTGVVFEGRRHWYECDTWEPVVFPAFAAHALGSRTLLLTNAAGGIRKDLAPGDLMVITDHINAMGSNPLRGPHHPDLGPRFPDLTTLYSLELCDVLTDAASAHDIDIKQGVYLAASGPTYETPAEVRAFAAMGAHAVGMSTVPEAILAGALGLKVAAVSCITNRAAEVGHAPLSHDEVITATQAATPRMRMLVRAFVDRLSASPSRFTP